MKAIIKFLDFNLPSAISKYMAGGKIVELNWDQTQMFRSMCKHGDCGIRELNKSTHIYNSENWNGFHPDIARNLFGFKK